MSKRTGFKGERRQFEGALQSRGKTKVNLIIREEEHKYLPFKKPRYGLGVKQGAKENPSLWEVQRKLPNKRTELFS